MDFQDSNERILYDCHAFCEKHGLSMEQLCRRAINDSRMGSRLFEGGSITVHKMDGLYAFMAQDESLGIINPMLKGRENGESKVEKD
jgi:hypothetical protein